MRKVFESKIKVKTRKTKTWDIENQNSKPIKSRKNAKRNKKENVLESKAKGIFESAEDGEKNFYDVVQREKNKYDKKK